MRTKIPTLRLWPFLNCTFYTGLVKNFFEKKIHKRKNTIEPGKNDDFDEMTSTETLTSSVYLPLVFVSLLLREFEFRLVFFWPAGVCLSAYLSVKHQPDFVAAASSVSADSEPVVLPEIMVRKSGREIQATLTIFRLGALHDQ